MTPTRWWTPSRHADRRPDREGGEEEREDDGDGQGASGAGRWGVHGRVTKHAACQRGARAESRLDGRRERLSAAAVHVSSGHAVSAPDPMTRRAQRAPEGRGSG